MLPFWYQLIFCRKRLRRASRQFGKRLEHFSIGGTLNSAQIERTRSWLRRFGEEGVCKFSFFDPTITNGTAGITLRNTEKSTVRGYHSTVKLAHDWLDILHNHDSRKKRLSQSRRLRVQFCLAITLIHELAHAVNNACSKRPNEPYCDNQIANELGRAWEVWAFGGAVRPARNLQRCSDGIKLLTP